MKPFVFFLVLFSLVFFLFSWGGASEDAHHLFRIERSKNKNIVQYDIRPMEEWDPSGGGAVVVYWILENGEKCGLSAIEDKFAYGIDSQKRLGENQYEIVLAAFKERTITIKKTGSGYKAFTVIDGREGILESIYVESRERLLGLPPSVLFIDLFGRDEQTDLPLAERVFSQ